MERYSGTEQKPTLDIAEAYEALARQYTLEHPTQYARALADFAVESHLVPSTIEPCSTNSGEGYRRTTHLPRGITLEHTYAPEADTIVRLSMPALSKFGDYKVKVQFGTATDYNAISAEKQGWHGSMLNRTPIEGSAATATGEAAARELGMAIDELVHQDREQPVRSEMPSIDVRNIGSLATESLVRITK